jgi:UDP-N-acetylglucosamine 1-carboxyvinyltransferase
MKFIITPRGALRGSVDVTGSKNAALPVLAAALLVGGRCAFVNVPMLSDVRDMCELLSTLGGRVNSNDCEISIDTSGITCREASYELVTRLRASFLVLGPLLARHGEARVPLPGGCAIGTRPVDLHLKGMAAMGATIDHAHGLVTATAKKLRGAKIYLDFPSVGATENIMMAASLADGVTTIENAAIEPEIVDLANFINTSGGKIRGAGTDTIRIEGVRNLSENTSPHTIIPDRIIAGTFMVAAAITRGCISLRGTMADHVKPVTAKLLEVGVAVTETDDGIQVDATGTGAFEAADIKTMPYPGFPTDMQSQFMALLATAKGTSVITETVFENRFMQAGELARMGADIKIESRSAIVEGVPRLAGAQVTATDLRAGAALVLAALAADGETEISAIHHIDRGYNALDTRLNALGADIRRI